MWAAPRGDHNRSFVALMAALIALAWLALWFWGRSPGGLFYGHHGQGAFGRGGSFALVFVAGWTVMVIAMMLPTSLPLITLFRTVTRRRRDRALLVALLVAGYIGVWTAFGALVYLGGVILRLFVRQSGWLEANDWVLGVGILALAGLYQFTPLKHRCLEKCRSPLSFVTEHWRGSHERTRALRLGAHHGLFCVGCCWSLMLLMFVVGAGSLGWMLVLGAVMAVEKNVSWGWRIGAPLGAGLVGLGLVLGTASALQPPATAEVTLVANDRSGAGGTATFTDAPGGVEVVLDVEGLPDPGATYLAHVHPGSCTGEPGGGEKDHAHGHHHTGVDRRIEKIEHPLRPVVSDAAGRGSSVSTIAGASIDRLFSGEELRVDVHAGASRAEGPSDSIACGEIER